MQKYKNNIDKHIRAKFYQGSCTKIRNHSKKGILKHVDELTFEIWNVQQGKHYLAMHKLALTHDLPRKWRRTKFSANPLSLYHYEGCSY